MSTNTKWLEVDDLPEVINCVRGTSDKVWARYLPEHTCRKAVGEHGHRWVCSECGETLLPRSPSTRYPDGIVNYCPSCGAKVVG